jgi:hypothetical protein
MLSQAHIAFYSTAATVIPVLALGSVLGAATLARTVSNRLDKLGETVHSGLATLIKNELALLKTTRTGRAFIDVELALLRFAFLGVGRRLVAPFLFLAVILPIAGEISALTVLSSGRVGPGTASLVWFGLGVSGIMALAPALETLIFFTTPFAIISNALRMVTAGSTEPAVADARPVPTGDAADVPPQQPAADAHGRPT